MNIQYFLFIFLAKKIAFESEYRLEGKKQSFPYSF